MLEPHRLRRSRIRRLRRQPPGTVGVAIVATKSQAAREAGALAEEAVACHLRGAGLDVLGRNVRVGRLELDVLAREGPVIVVVEVRVRGAGAWVRALDSVDAKKRERLRRAGERLWSERFAEDPSVERMRFDIAAVSFTAGEPRIEIVRGAF